MNQAIKLVNKFRVSRGLKELKPHSFLTAAAQKHSEEMASRGVMSHRGNNGSSAAQRMAAAGYRWLYTGECVGKGGDAETIVQMWIDHGPHRVILLGSQYTHIGIGEKNLFWTADFANGMRDEAPLPSIPAVDFNLW